MNDDLIEFGPELSKEEKNLLFQEEEEAIKEAAKEIISYERKKPDPDVNPDFLYY